jgi:hypothetical protein
VASLAAQADHLLRDLAGRGGTPARVRIAPDLAAYLADPARERLAASLRAHGLIAPIEDLALPAGRFEVEP